MVWLLEFARWFREIVVGNGYTRSICPDRGAFGGTFAEDTMTDTTEAGGLRFLRAPGRLRQAGLLACWILGQVGSAQAALGTAFTYQGQLKELGLPASGVYDFEFKLFDASSAGAQVGPTVSAGDVAVSAGLFSLTLDFGPVFGGQSRFLEIGVRPGASVGAHTLLGPRQELTPTPTALYAATATTVNGLACANEQIPKWSGGAWTCGAVSFASRVFRTPPMTGTSFVTATLAGINVCADSAFHACTVWEAMVLDTVSDTAIFDQQGWVAGSFPNVDSHMRSLASGQDSVICPAGSHITKYPSAFVSGAINTVGGPHCTPDGFSAPVWCCRNKS